MRIPLGHLVHINACALSEDVDPETEIQYADFASVDLDTAIVTPRPETFGSAPSRARRLVRQGDTVIPYLTGSSGWARTRPLLIGSADLSKIVFSTGFYSVTPTPKVDARFVNYAMSTKSFLSELQAVSSGVTMKGYTSEQLGKCKIHVPSVTDQVRIADYLDTKTTQIDALVEKKQQMIEALSKRQMVLESSIVLAAGSQPSPIPTIPTVPAGWRVLRNKVFMREVNKPSLDGTEEMLSVSHLTGVTPRSEKMVYMFEAESTVGYKMVQPGDLVINTMWAWMGAAGVARVPGIVSPAYGVYRIDPTIMTPDYFDIVVRTSAYITEMTRFSRGVTSSRLRLYPEEFLGLSSPVPPVEEQPRIVERCFAARTRTSRLIERLERQINLLREQRQAVITSAVTGELAVPGVVA
jgi:type I restriction enzyme S subunit